MKTTKFFNRVLFAASLLATPFAFGAGLSFDEPPPVRSNLKPGVRTVSYVKGTDMLGKKLVAIGHSDGTKVTIYQNSFSQMNVF